MNPKAKRKAKQLWIESAMLGVVIAFALALLISALAAGTSVVEGAVPAQVNTQGNGLAPGSVTSATVEPASAQHFEGMVTCSRCGAKHSAKLAAPATQCAINCVREGAKFALIDGENTYQLDGDLGTLKRLAGQRAQVVGVARGNTIKVSSIAASS